MSAAATFGSVSVGRPDGDGSVDPQLQRRARRAHLLGTAGYLAPEQASGRETTTASDRYALAVVADELLTGHRPFERGSETATRYRFADGAPGEIGIIAPVTEPFCGACSRVRLTADGQIRTCLFSKVEHSLRDVIRSGATPAETADYIKSVVLKKEPRHYINETYFEQPARTMSLIGG